VYPEVDRLVEVSSPYPLFYKGPLLRTFGVNQGRTRKITLALATLTVVL
jgi:hypothetical protein